MIYLKLLGCVGLLVCAMLVTFTGMLFSEIASGYEAGRHRISWRRRSILWLILGGLLFILFIYAALPAPAAELPPTRSILWALRQIESGDDAAAIGARGERGAYQFTRSAWAQANRLAGTRHPFAAAHHPATAHRLAAAYVRWLATFTSAPGRPLLINPHPEAYPDAVRLFAVWNLGPRGSVGRGGPLPPVVLERARRFEALLTIAP